MSQISAQKKIRVPRFSNNARFSASDRRLPTLWIFISVLSWCGGCDSTGEDIKRETAATAAVGGTYVGTAISPRWTIDQCVREYQRLDSYQDDAYAKLQYRLDGQLMEDRAPLSVAWAASGPIGLRVYSIEAGPVDGRWRLRLRNDELTVPRQVLSRALPKNVDFEWLLSDPLVAERMSAGLAGFPPQLDLLLSERPLQNLADDSAALSFRKPETIDGRSCYVVHIQRGSAAFVLWIDQASLLLRRLQLPQSHLTPQMQEDQRVTDILLTIEFANIRINSPVDWDRFAVESKSDDLRVSRFVPAPPLVETTGLGEKLPAFFLESPDGRPVYSSSGGAFNRKVTVLMWLADHPTCRVAAEQLSRVADRLQEQGLPAGTVEFVSIWAELEPPADCTFETLAAKWRMPGQLALDRDAMGRDLMLVQEAPTLVILDQNNRLQLREARLNPVWDQLLPPLLMRLVEGEDLAADALRVQHSLATRHAVELRLAAALDASPPPSPLVPSHEPLAFELRELSRQRSTSAAMAATVDSSAMVWTLYSDGELQQHDVQGKVVKTFQSRWNVDGSGRSRITVSDCAEHFCFCQQDSSVIQLFDCSTQQSRTVELGSGTRVNDFQWLHLGTRKSARLAVVTSEDQTLLLDPADREQLSGRCPAEPLAVLPGLTHRGELAAHVVMFDGSLEPLQLEFNAALPSLTASGQSVSHAVAVKSSAELPKKLTFQPAAGPWLTWRDGEHELTLARGWLATDEPAVFMLDQQLKPLWHYRLPLQTTARWPLMAVANDPATGQPVWAIASPANTIHVLRADGLRMDHLAVTDTLIGMALVPSGNRLLLRLVHADEAVSYALQWK